jgi:serine/threonine protein kinase
MIGKTISHYKILEKLGSGGMGTVYKAQDTKLDRFVALKFLPPHIGADDNEKKRFIHEAKAASALQHNNICTIHEIGETDDGQMFICMDYYEGETLKKKIERGPLKLEDAIDISIQIAQGLAKAHSKEIIHRDIKPANILLTEEEQVKIVDFGLAKLAGQTVLTKEGTTIGTVAYMSPEQARGEVVDHRTDIWAVGVVLFEMLTGELPFKGEYEHAIIYSIINEEPKPIVDKRPEMIKESEEIVNKTLTKEKEERYQNIGDLLVKLRSLKERIQPDISNKQALRMKPLPSIAVLPFRDMSPQKDQDYFCEGIAEEIINALTHIEGLRVIARTSAFAFKDKFDDVREIGKKLGVETLLEGSVRKSGNRLRITAQLITVADGSHLWSERYDREIDDLFLIQDEVSLQITENLKIRLAHKEKIMLAKRYTEDIETYNLYLKGRFHWAKYTEEGFKKGIEYYQQAIQRDPTYALAYAGVAICHTFLGYYLYLNPKDEFDKAEAAAKKALEIDDCLSEALLALGWIKVCRDRNWSGSETVFRQTLDLNPGYSTGHLFYAILLSVIGRNKEAIAEAEKAEELDPLSPLIGALVGLR